MTRSRRAVLMLALLGVGLILLSASRTWAGVRLAGAPGLTEVLVSGRREVPAAVPVALAAAAAAVVLAIAGRVLRLLVAAGLAIAGVALAIAAASAGRDASGAESVALRGSFGLVGTQRLNAAVLQVHSRLTFWPWVAVAGAVLIAAAGLLAVARGWSWPVSGRRFERPDDAALEESGDPAAPAGRQPVMVENGGPRSTWDALSRGEDPTSTGEDAT